MKKEDKLKASLEGVKLPWIEDRNTSGKTKSGRSENKSLGRSEVKTSERSDVPGLNFIKAGKKNYYLSKTTGEVIQKVTVHLPFMLVLELKGESTLKGKSLSGLIREKVAIVNEIQKAEK